MNEMIHMPLFDNKIRPVLVNHEICDLQLLIQTGEHDLLVDALVVASDEIHVQVNIQIVKRLSINEGLESHQIIDIKTMLRKNRIVLSQKLQPVSQAVHKHILRPPENDRYIS